MDAARRARAVAVIAVLSFTPAVAASGFDEVRDSHVDGNVPSPAEFTALLRRDLDAYFNTSREAHPASTVHVGPYSGLGAAHDAVIRWCQDHRRTRAGVWWEVYGDWHEDPAELETEIHYALLPGSDRAIE